MPLPPAHDHLCDTLRAENDALRSLTELLRDEQQLLIKGKIDGVAACVEPKARRLLELTRLGEQRTQLLRDCGQTPDRAGMERLLDERYAGDSKAIDAWRQLLQLATAANQINISNGLLISAHMKTTQRALSTLFTSARLPAAYTPEGGTVSYRAAKQIAVA